MQNEVALMIYIDNEFKCHITGDDTMRAISTNAFDGKCDSYIEGCRFVPNGETFVRSDGTAFTGEMVSPWKPSSYLESVQRIYEQEQLADADRALAILWGGEEA